MDKNYDHKKEKEIYQKWEPHFAPSSAKASEGKPFTILMPPPNANASLHAGHAMYTIDDIVTRWKRMQGYSTVWVPGMDHAGFETQFVYEKNLAKEGKSRLDFDRQTLYDNVYKFVQDNSGLIFEQFKALGFSADWSRSVFTLDQQVLDQVITTFKRMVEEGKVYRDNYIVNYCTHCGTSLAELEVEYEEKIDPFIYMKYGPFTVGTVRPETKFRDTALAVNPKDKRYKKYIGQTMEIMGLLGPMKMTIIADDEVDPKFGTGIMKVTPAHDPHDFELGRKFGLPVTPIIDREGRMDMGWFLDQPDTDPKYRARAEKYHRKKIAEMRTLMIEDLKEDGLLVKIDENYSHRVGTCYKCKRVLEPTVILNWFIKVAELKQPVIEAVKADRVKFYPKRFKRAMLEWLKVMHDWPISRQIVWGIRIPVWYNVSEVPNAEVATIIDGKKIRGKVAQLVASGLTVSEIGKGLQSIAAPKDAKFVVSPTPPGENYLQETDTFDTWFSSGQWPLVTLNKDEYKTRFPTDFMGTLADILKFWVSRMIMFSLYVRDEVPFKDVYLWSMVADAKGQKMSKSKGNVINPMTFIDKYGADALRMTMVYGVAAGGQVNLAEDKVRGMRNFANKIWNAARFVQNFTGTGPDDGAFGVWYSKTIPEKVTKYMEKYNLNSAAELMYETFWHEYCDLRVEEAKKGKYNAKQMKECLDIYLKLLHPFMPFVTEAIWQELGNKDLLMTARWPID